MMMIVIQHFAEMFACIFSFSSPKKSFRSMKCSNYSLTSAFQLPVYKVHPTKTNRIQQQTCNKLKFYEGNEVHFALNLF